MGANEADVILLQMIAKEIEPLAASVEKGNLNLRSALKEAFRLGDGLGWHFGIEAKVSTGEFDAE